MQSVDGDVRLSVGLDTQPVKKNVENLGRTVQSTLNQFGDAKGVDALSAKAKQLELNVEKAAKKVSALRDKLNEAESTKVPTEEFQELGKDIDWVEKKLDDLTRRRSEITSRTTIAGTEVTELKEIEAEISVMENELRSLHEARQELINTGKANTVDSQALDEINQKLHQAQSEYDLAVQKVNEFNAAQKESSGTSFKANFEKVANITKTTLNKAGKYFKTFTSVAKSAFNRVASLAKSAFKTVTSHAKNSSKNAGNAITNINGAFRKGLKTILRYGLGIRGTFMLFRKLRSAVSEGLKNLVQYSDEVNADISGLMSAFTKLKNSLATMFQPLIKIVAPILTTLINKASQVATSIGKVIAAFAGQSYVYEAVDIQEDYAKSLDKTSKSAKNAEKALDNYLSPLDDINKFQEASNNTDDNDDDGTVDPSKMFKLSAVGDKFKDLASRLKEVLKSNDWTSLGQLVGDKLNSILDKIDWTSIHEKAKLFATRLFTLINGFVSSVDWSLVGNTIANGIKTALTFITTFIQGLDFSAIGEAIGQIFNSLASPENTKLLAESISGMLSGVLDLLISSISTIDWGKVSDAIISFISNFDFEKLSTLAINLLNGIAKALRSIKFDEIAKAFSEGLSNIDWGGIWDSAVSVIGSAFQGLGNLFGIDVDTSEMEKSLSNLKEPIGELLDAFKTLLEEILPPIVNDLVPALATLLGDTMKSIAPIIKALAPVVTLIIEAVSKIVNSLSPVLPVIGDTIAKIVEFLTPIIEFVTELVAKVVEALAPALEGIFTLLGAIFEIAQPFLEIAIQTITPIIDIISGIVQALSGVIEFLSGVFSGDWEMAWDGLKNIFSGIWNAILGIISSVWESIKSIFSGAWEFITRIWSNITGFFSGIWEGIQNAFQNAGTWFADIFSNAWNGIKKIWDGVVKFFQSIWNGIVGVFKGIGTWFSNIFKSAVDGIKNAWNGVKTFFKNLWEGIWNVIKTPINWIIGAINAIIGGLNTLKIDIPDWVPFVGGQTWGFNIPEIPYLAKGAVIPPNQEFLAVLGDQKRGNNIEAPEGLIRKIIREELANSQNSGNVYEVPLVVGRKTLAKLVIDEAKLMLSQTGKNPFDLITV